MRNLIQSTACSKCYLPLSAPASKDPTTINFDLQEDAIPQGFFCENIKTRNSHHLKFANDKMIYILSQAKHWFIDGTFKIVRQPFTQLLSVHAFIKCDDSLKQIPLMFVVMSDIVLCIVNKLNFPFIDTTPRSSVRTSFLRRIRGRISSLPPGRITSRPNSAYPVK